MCFGAVIRLAGVGTPQPSGNSDPIRISSRFQRREYSAGKNVVDATSWQSPEMAPLFGWRGDAQKSRHQEKERSTPRCAARPGFGFYAAGPVQFFTPALFLDGPGHLRGPGYDHSPMARYCALVGLSNPALPSSDLGSFQGLTLRHTVENMLCLAAHAQALSGVYWCRATLPACAIL